MTEPISVVSDLARLIPLAWNKLRQEVELAADADRELDMLKEFNVNIQHLLYEAYSKEVIDEPGINIMHNFLYKSEDAIEDLGQRESRDYSSLFRYYNKRTFTVESGGTEQRWVDYISNLGLASPVEISSGNNHPQISSAIHRPLSDVFLDKSDDALVGMQGPVNRLLQLLTTDPPTKVIFVHGPQGVGKSTLVAAVLRHQDVSRRFKFCLWIEDLRSWELTANTETALMEANATLWDFTVERMNNQGHRSVEVGEALKSMKAKVATTPSNFSWALVLDDAGRADVFNILRDHLSETRPTVFVTTRVRSLKSSSMDYLKKALYVALEFEHVLLSENLSRSLFYRRMEYTFGDLSLKCENSPILRGASERMLRRCQGLPLAILAMCKLLEYKKEHDVRGDCDAVQWEKLSGRLEEALLSKGHVVDPNGMKITLRMEHVLDVPDCFFYLSMFPLDRPINCSTMMRLWIAERFIAQEGSQPVQGKAEETLARLAEHNVIREQRTSYGRVKTGHVHNLLHQMIISKSKDEGYAMIVSNPNEKLRGDARYLSYHCRMDNINNGTSVKRLRSLHLHVFEDVYPPSLEGLLTNVERLKVLHVHRYLTKEGKKDRPAFLTTFPRSILRSRYLRYLSLRGTDVRCIPEEIKVLVYLESLDLRDTLVLKLPDGILKLTSLCHLLVSRCSRSGAADTGVKAPSKLGDLRSLQKLCMIKLEGGNRRKRERFLEELRELTDLRRLGLSMLRTTDAVLLCSSIEKLTNLEALRLIAAPGQEIDLSKKDLGQLECLQRVNLTGRLGILPEWIFHSDFLVKLVLKMSELTVDAVQQLGELLHLKHLELEQAFDLTEIRFEAEKFQELCFLGLYSFDELESIQVDAGALPALERFSLARCDSLTVVPPFITRHTKLKCLEICGMPKEFNGSFNMMLQELRERMMVEFDEKSERVVEEPEELPAQGPLISCVPRLFKK